jgi:glycerol-3-phosphate acyltransferase PlsY
MASIDWANLPSYLAALAFGYLCGSIPFGVLLTKFAGTRDIRSVGSGNIGATNVLRTGRKGLAAGTLLGDALKGTFAVLATSYVFGPSLALAAGLGAFVGHLYPVWLRFKGGKGVSTYIGLLIALAWPVALAFCVVWVAVAAISRYSSLAGLIASGLTPLVLAALDQRAAAALFALLTIMLWIRHRENISRLISGTESRIGQGSKSVEA